MRIGLNGFGRIGRTFTRVLFERYPEVELVAINDLMAAKQAAHLFRHDSNYGPYPGSVSSSADAITIDGKVIEFLSEREPARLPWRRLNCDVVIEATGAFSHGKKARAHIDGGGASKVIISANADEADLTIVLGVNHEQYDPARHHVISAASCTTNCLATVAKTIVASLGWRRGFMTTVHSYTNDQNVLDAPHHDLRRARNAATNIIPTTTGAAKGLHIVIPEVENRFDGFALRVPTPTVSLIYLVANVEKATSTAELRQLFQSAPLGTLKDVVSYSEDLLVSSDVKQTPYSAVVDASLLTANEDLIQAGAWYDNEWAYSCRLADVAHLALTRSLPATPR